MTNFGMLSMNAYRNSARNTGKPSLNRRITPPMDMRRDFGVSSSASGNVMTTNDRMAAMPMAMLAMPRSCVRNSTMVHVRNASSERAVCEMPAKYSLSICCRRPS